MPLLRNTVIRRILIGFCISVFLAFGAAAGAVAYYAFGTPPVAQLPLPDKLIALDSPQGRQWLNESGFRQDYEPLRAHFESQKRRAYCGVASAVMVLNALAGDPATTVPPRWDQANFFTPQARAVRSPLQVTFAGMSLDEFAALLGSHAVDAEAIPASASTLEQFRQMARENVGRGGDYIVVNYQRGDLGQPTVGHISPLAAYHEPSDRFLIMDVTRYEYPPVWVATADLWNAMRTLDSSSGKTRGWATVSR